MVDAAAAIRNQIATKAATLCANPACSRAKRHPGLCTDEIAARTGLTVEQVQTVLDFDEQTSAEDADENLTYAQTVTRLARLANRLEAEDGGMSEQEFYEIEDRLHAAADRAGIPHEVAEADYMDEVKAGPVVA